jgi:hypothetical protein
MENNPKPTHSMILSALKADLKSAERLKQDNDEKITRWRNEYDGKPYGNEVKGRSAIVSRDVKKQSEWQHASLVDPFVSTSEIVRCYPITYEDKAAAKQNELLLNTQFCRKFDRYNFVSKAVKVLDMEGTAIVQTGWDYESKKVMELVDTVRVTDDGVEYIEQVETEIEVTVRNQPTAIICRNEDVFLDPTCMDDLDKAQFVIYRYETDISTLKKDGRFKNLEKLTKNGADGTIDPDYDAEDETVFQFQDEPRKKILVYEYWGNYDVDGDGIAEPIVCAWAGNIIIRMESNPYPDGRPPFLVVPFNSVPFRLNGEANAELIGDNQKVKTAILRGILDNMAQSTNGQVGVRKGALDTTNRARYLQGRNFEFNGTPQDFWQGSYNSIPGSAFDMLGLMNNEIESLTGVKSFSGGITGSSLGASATAARGALDATAVRRMNIVRNISENLIKPLLRKWMSYNAVFLEDEEVVRITNEEFVPIRRDDLEGRIDVDITVATAEDNAAKAQELSFLLQTIGPNADPEVRNNLMADILELMRMPEEAKRIREYKPAPDPMAVRMQELQIQNLERENEKLAADAAYSQARAEEARYNMAYTARRAQTEEAKARKTNSEADNLDMQFLQTDEGVDQRRKDEEFERQRLHELDTIVLQAQLGDKNLGVTR